MELSVDKGVVVVIIPETFRFAFKETSPFTNSLLFIETSPCKIVSPFVYIFPLSETSDPINKRELKEAS